VVALLQEETAPRRGNGYQDPDINLMLTLDKTPGVSFLPYGEPRTRRAPRFDDFGIRARIRTNPFEKVKDQGFDRLGHEFLLVGSDLPALQTIWPSHRV